MREWLPGVPLWLSGSPGSEVSSSGSEVSSSGSERRLPRRRRGGRARMFHVERIARDGARGPHVARSTYGRSVLTVRESLRRRSVVRPRRSCARDDGRGRRETEGTSPSQRSTWNACVMAGPVGVTSYESSGILRDCSTWNVGRNLKGPPECVHRSKETARRAPPALAKQPS